MLLAGDVVISEFLSRNDGGLADEDGDRSDWIEIANRGDAAVNLDGWFLTDRANQLTKWEFPAETIEVGEFLVVFASGKDRDLAGAELHTNFRLDGDGEYLALVEPDRMTIAHQFSPEFPPQIPDVSYGLAEGLTTTELISSSATVTSLVPSDDLLGESWTAEAFDDSTWTSSLSALGFEVLDSGTTLRDDFDASLGPEWTVDIPAGGTSSVSVADGSLNLDVPPSQGNSATSRGLAPFVYRNDLRANEDYSMVTHIDTSQGSGTRFAGVGVFAAAADRIGLSIEYVNNVALIAWSGGSNVAILPGLSGHSGIGLRLDRDVAADSWSSFYRFDEADEWIFWRTFVEGEDILEIADPKPGVTVRTNSNGSIVAKYDFIEFTTAGPSPQYASAIDFDLESQMHGTQSSAYVRVPFEVSGDPAQFDRLTLSVAYDDGFVAYLNGEEVASRNAPAERQWNASATGEHLAVAGGAPISETIDLTAYLGSLHTGTNILAIQGLNQASDGDFFIMPQLSAAQVVENLPQYFTEPTPDSPNTTGSQELGPLVTDVTEILDQPGPADSLAIEATLTETLHPIATVDLVYRVMFNTEVSVSMNDDGSGADRVAGDGIFTGGIPGGIAQPGEMLRWLVEATDSEGNATRAPTFAATTGQNQSPEYFGTVIADQSVTSDIGILDWFLQPGTEGAAQSRGGTRASLFYHGEFYDNVFVRIRGGSTATGGPVGKPNFKFDFKGDTFRFDEQYPRVEEFNLNSTSSDKAYIRQPLAFEAYSEIGSPGSISFPLHVRRNNQFYGVFVFIEQPDEELLEREGLDRNGALYKMYSEFRNGVGRADPKTDQAIDKSGLNSLFSNIRSLSGQALTDYMFDNLDIPRMLNYLVATVITHQNDNPHKNHYLYQDTNGTGEWFFLPWDHDLTWGSNWIGTSYSDVIYADNDSVPGRAANVAPSHPLINSRDFVEWNNHWNGLMDAMLTDPVIQDLFLRRLRTSMDELLGTADTPAEDRWIDQRLDDWVSLMAPDVALDLNRWANPWRWGANQSFVQSIDAIRDDYLPRRRTHLFETHNIDNLEGGGEEPDPPTVIISGNPGESSASYFVPSDNTLGTTWTELNFDDSLWNTGPAGFGYDNNPTYLSRIGTTVRSTDTCATCTTFLTRFDFNIDDLASIDALTLRMQYDDGFVAYLNGTEVARRNVTANPVSFSTTATNHPDGAATVFENINISSNINLLNQGANVLAIRAVNTGTTSSDMLMLVELVEGTIVTPSGEVAGIPHAQDGNPTITIDTANIDFNPSSGNQDQEFIPLLNPNNVAVDISGWTLSGGVEHTFRKGTVIPAGGTLYVTPSSRAFRARSSGPSGGQGLFVQDGYEGHLSNFGELLELSASDGQTIDSVTTPSDPSDVQLFLRITEIMYNPGQPTAAEAQAGFTDNDDFEYIELTNISEGPGGVTLVLDGVQLTRGIEFTIPVGTSLAPGERLVIARDIAAFEARYGAGIAIAAEYRDPLDGSNRLNNDGEAIKVEDIDSSTIHEFQYNDSWYRETDGQGRALQIADATGDLDDWDISGGWGSTGDISGTPGGDGSLTADFNSDRRVGLIDLAILQHNHPTASATHDDGDLTGDGAITRGDIHQLATFFGRSYTPTTPEPEAEPTPRASAALTVAVDKSLASINLGTMRRRVSRPIREPLTSAPRRAVRNLDITAVDRTFEHRSFEQGRDFSAIRSRSLDLSKIRSRRARPVLSDQVIDHWGDSVE